jgi:hypothetical protein
VHILTERLIDLTGPSLPLPWYHRAPLGLLTDTPAYVALQEPSDRPVGDLIVSVVDPAHWPFVSQITAWREDAPGVLADVYHLAPPLNIVSGEAVTVDSGGRHYARLLVEPFNPPDEYVKADAEVEIDRIKQELDKRGFREVKSRFIHPEAADPAWVGGGRVDLGWAHVEGWREAVNAQACAHPEGECFDLDMAVISADTERRILRYVFPRKGAVSVSIKHADRPGSAWKVTNALGENGLNILSSLLRRGSAAAFGKAELVAVVEPADSSIEPAEVEERVREALSRFPATLLVKADVSGPVDAAHVLYPRRPHEIAVRPGEALGVTVVGVRKTLPPDRCPIFISRRFVDSADQDTADIVEELRAALHDHGCIAVEATPQGGSETGVRDEVKARMWASDGAVLLVVSTPDERDFTENLAHEFGFMEGQGKPLLSLVQEDVSRAVTKNPNLMGVQLSTFTRESATNRQRPNSVYQSVSRWLNLCFGLVRDDPPPPRMSLVS